MISPIGNSSGGTAIMADDKTLILYGVGSPNVRKVGLMLEELGLSYELRFVPVFEGEQFTPEFLAMNPLGKVPVLVDPALGEPLFESGAILFYLAERHGKFLPAEGTARYQVMQWVMVQMANIGPMFGQLTHFRFALGTGAQSYAEGRYAEQARRLYQLLEDRLGTHEWIAGGAYSIADMATYHWSTYLEKHGFDPKAYPSLVRWRDKISARPAVARHVARFSQAFDAGSARDRKEASDADIDRFFGRTASAPKVSFAGIRS
jgi:GST-like protein